MCKCIICKEPHNETFYDKGNMGRCDNGGTRYLCSKDCYSVWFDKCLEGILLDNVQKEAQRKRCIEHYYKHQDLYKTKYKNRYAKQAGLCGAI